MSDLTITPEMIQEYDNRTKETKEDFIRNLGLSFRQALNDTNPYETNDIKLLSKVFFNTMINSATTASCEEKAIINFYHSGNHKNENEKYCVVCNQEFKKHDVCRKRDKWDCPHLFHGKCINTLGEIPKCPICNTKVENKLMSFDEMSKFNIKFTDNNGKK